MAKPLPGASKAVYFSSASEFRAWLETNHSSAAEMWLGFYKVSAKKKGITYSEALDEALCYGWIDAVRYSVDGESYKIRFTPRRTRSVWSLVNVARVKALQKAERMADPGLKVFAARERHRTGIYAFEQKRPGLSAKYKKLFRANKQAWVYFAKQAPWYQRTAGYWVVSAKQEETRLRRLATLMKDSSSGRRLAQLIPKAKRQSQ
jgi:uncharacterized protein YdeI (YjbR/CyaY-like superfamily)